MTNVSFGYDHNLVLEDVSLTIGRHESLAVVGPNGGGKTTLLKLILGVLSPRHGTIRVLGTTPRQARPRVGYMPQSNRFDPQFPATCGDVVLMGRLGGRWLGWYSRRDHEVAADSLDEVGLAGFERRPFADLSGGQRQRVLIARALACQPELLLLDEPTSNVDKAAEQQFFDILTALGRRMTILMVSHDLGVVSQVVDSVVCVSREVAVHPTSELTGEVIREMYGADVRMVRHDHRCSEEGHRHD